MPTPTPSTDVVLTLGAAFSGCLVAVALSALVGFQTFIYFLIFPADSLRYKLLVFWVWLTDCTHTILVCVSLWLYTIVNFENPGVQSRIFPTLALVVSMTGIITFSVNGFYIYRIHKLSKQNWFISGPILFLTFARLGLGLTTTANMIRVDDFAQFKDHFKILFTAGLFVSALSDVIISVARYYYLRDLREGYATSREMVDTTVVFTINDGALTCVVVIACIVCWLTMTTNFVYLAFYFTIAKLYSNSLLATLNLRNWFRHRFNLARPADIIVGRPNGFAGVHVAVDRDRATSIAPPSSGKNQPIEIAQGESRVDKVDRHVAFESNDGESIELDQHMRAGSPKMPVFE